jgi:methionine aminopeptidase
MPIHRLSTTEVFPSLVARKGPKKKKKSWVHSDVFFFFRSVNEVICHGIPDTRPLQDGDIVNIDITAYYEGFHGDVNATYLVGNVDEKYKKLVQVTKEALDKAIEIGRRRRKMSVVQMKF